MVWFRGGVTRIEQYVLFVLGSQQFKERPGRRVRRKRAAHTEIMQISEQIIDEPLFWRHSRQ